MEEAFIANGLNILEGEGSSNTHYVVDNKIVPRPHNPALLENNVIKNVPMNSSLLIEDTLYENKEDTEIELSFNHPGRYQITLIKWPYLNKEFVYENPPQ